MVTAPEELRSKLCGAIGFPVTPFTRDLSLDIAALRTNLRAMLVHPLAAVVAAGGTGEIYSLTPDEHLQVVRATVEEAANRAPVIAGVGFNVRLGVQLAEQAQRAGASGILVFPPYYPLADDEGLLAYYEAICSATPLGVLVYSRDWFHPTPSFVKKLTHARTFIAWKDGQADVRRLQMIQREVGDRLHWVGGAGDDMVPGYYAIGIRAFTSSIANVSSRVAVQLHDAAASGDSGTLSRLLNDLVVPLYALRGRRRGYEVTVMKELMTLLGLRGGAVRPPLPALAAADLEALQAMAERWKSYL